MSCLVAGYTIILTIILSLKVNILPESAQAVISFLHSELGWAGDGTNIAESDWEEFSHNSPPPGPTPAWVLLPHHSIIGLRQLTM